MTTGPTIAELSAQLEAGKTTARQLVEACLARIEDPEGEGRRVFLYIARKGALAAADAIDALRKAGAHPSPLAGIPVSVKDLFDIKGQTTRAGSRALDGAPPATADAVTVARLKRAGLIVIGRTNMTEFAYSGVGYNPHYGTPGNAYERAARRIPGGSSSGAAVSVTDGMAHMGLGTDTGGSCRIPAALNGIVGYKPTQRRVPTGGALPLSTTLDSVGPLARTVACCAAVDAVLAGEPQRPLEPARLSRLTLGVPQNLVLDGMDGQVAASFERALKRLSEAGARIERLALPELDEIPLVNAKGGFSAVESYAWHRQLIEAKGDSYDPRVLARIKRGLESSGVDYYELLLARSRLMAAVAVRTRDLDALAMPSVPIVAPRLDDLARDEEFARVNVLLLRNPSLINFLDGCAISLPMHEAGEAPTGLMLAAGAGRDHHLFACSAAVEACLARSSGRA